MELKNFFAQDAQGNKLSDALCYVYQRGTESLVGELYKPNGSPLSNPFSTDQSGLAQFAAANGLYDVRVIKGDRDYRLTIQFNDVAETVESANQAAVRAEVARDVAQLSSGIKDDVAHGLSTTTSGTYFTVKSPDDYESLIVYRNSASVAVEQYRYSSAKAVKLAMPKKLPLGPKKDHFVVAVGGKVMFALDKNGKLISDHSHPEVDAANASLALLQVQTPKRLPLGPLNISFGVKVGNKWLMAVPEKGGLLGQSNTSPVVTDAASVNATSLVAAQPILMKDPAYTLALVIHKIIVGQSNAFGRGSWVLTPEGAYAVMGTTASPVMGDVFSKTDSVYGDYCLTLFSTDTTDFRVLKAEPNFQTDASGNITGSGETLLSGWANGFQKWLRDGHYLTQRMVGTVHAMGGTKYPVMKKGTATYSQALDRVTKAKAIATTKGWNYEVQSISIVHGEAEGSDTTQSIYEGYLLEWWSDYNADFKAITGQQRDLAAFLIGLSTFTADNQQIALAQLAACEKYPALVYVCPSYMFPYGDEVHRLAKGNFKHGEYEMRAERFWIAGKKWNPLKPKSITKVDNVVTVQFNNTVYGTSETPGPVGALTLDTINVTNPGDYGFRVADSTTSIVSVALGADGASVVITLSSTPEPAAKIEYAMQYDLRNTGAPADPYIRFPTAGARGNLRDSDVRDLSGFDNAPLYNWLVPFRQTIS